MANGDVPVTIVGNITNDPELRFTPSGAAVANFNVAVNRRVLDKATNEWKDGEAQFFRCSVWRQFAENVAESLSRGTRVIVSGRLVQREYEANGEKRRSVEIEVDSVGPDLRYATAKIAKVARSDGQGAPAGGDGWGGNAGGGSWGAPAGAPAQGGQGRDPWATPAQYDEPPF